MMVYYNIFVLFFNHRQPALTNAMADKMLHYKNGSSAPNFLTHSHVSLNIFPHVTAFDIIRSSLSKDKMIL